MRQLSRFLACFLILISAADLFAQRARPESKAEVVAEVETIQPGEPFYVAIVLEHPELWHSYYENPGYLGQSLGVKWEMPEGFTTGNVIWPAPHASQVPGVKGKVTVYGYDGKNTFLVEVTPPADLAAGTEVEIKGNASWQICDDSGCIPEDTSFSIPVTVGDTEKTDEKGAAIVKAALEKMPKSAADLDVTIAEANSKITMTANIPEEASSAKSAYFYSADMQVDAQVEQDSELSDGKLKLVMNRNLGNEDNFIDPGPVLETLRGVLVFKDADKQEVASYQVALRFDGEPIEGEEVPAVAEQTGESETIETPSKEDDHVVFEPTPEEIAEGAKLYDPNAKPEYVMLDGAEEKKNSLLPLLGLLFLGGLILNLMPCVFPVLGLKIMGFVQQAGEDEHKVKNHGLIFGLGVLISMWILAAFIVALDLDWGGQMQIPGFVAGVVLLLFIMGLNFCGVFEIGTSLTGVGGDLQRKKGYSGSFFSGILTTLIATPCSGPFLGTAMGAVLPLAKESPIQAFIAFSVFAAGIASPYVILAFFPKAIAKLPKPGAWMETFKVAMAFPVFATAVFFFRTFARQTGYEGMTWFLFAVVTISMAAWIYGRWGTLMQSKGTRYGIGFGLAAVFALSGIQMVRVASSKTAPVRPVEGWKQWYPGIMEVTRTKKRIAWIDYTADW